MRGGGEKTKGDGGREIGEKTSSSGGRGGGRNWRRRRGGGGGGGPGGGRKSKEGRVERKEATAHVLVQRASTLRFVGKEGHSNRCFELWDAVPHSGQRSFGRSPILNL